MTRYSRDEPFLADFFADLRVDFSGTTFFFLQKAINYIRRFASSFFCLLNFRIKGVKVLINNKFWGFTILSRYPQSEIIIGGTNAFDSSKNVNLIGVNRQCILSTHARNAKIQIGNKNGFSGVTIAAFNKIVIGNNVKVGANVLITDSNWHPEDPRSGESVPVIIKDNVWIGVNCVVLKGVTIGENSIIGANSVVVKNIPANSMASGNPCKVIKTINKIEK